MTMKTKKFLVRIRAWKLEGLFLKGENESLVLQMKIKWDGLEIKNGFFSNRKGQQMKYTERKLLSKSQGFVEWEDEFQKICSFCFDQEQQQRGGSLFGSWDISFELSDDGNSIGRVSLDLQELALNAETRLPILLQIDGVCREATLVVHSIFAEIRSDEPMETVSSSSQPEKKEGFFKLVRSLTGYKKKKKGSIYKDQVHSSDSDESSLFDSSSSPSTSASSSRTESGMSSSLETQPDPVVKKKLFSWKRRKLSFRKQEHLFKKINEIKNDDVEEKVSFDQQRPVNILESVQKFEDASCATRSDWHLREIVSRDGNAKLKANVFLASFDQRSEEASGESACTAIVAVIADWLHSNPDATPMRNELDSLITEGCSEWRTLCDNETYTNFFPDKHFDLETVLEADLRPIHVSRERSYTGFFSPEKFESLKEAMSFDQIWNAISVTSNNTEVQAPGIYIVSWNDHFFVLKSDTDAFYIIDSLGERLFEGCNRAYILKFDKCSLMYEKKVSAQEEEQEQECEEIICRGKECCGEYIKRFLAAIPLRELEAEENKRTVSAFSLLQRLQIDFNYCSSTRNSFSSSE